MNEFRTSRRGGRASRIGLAVLLLCVAATPSSGAEPAAPEFVWAIAAGGPQHDKTRGIAVDGAGNVFLTGEYTGTARFGDHSLTAVGSMDFFVAKVSPEGKFLWVRSGGGDKIDRGYAVTTDADGACYVTGHFESATATFGESRIASRGDYDLFVAKYDAAGRLVWIHAGGGPGYDYGHGIAADKLGQVFVTGAVAGEGTFVDEPLGSAGPAHVFCLALAADGRVKWRRSAAGPGSSSGHGVAVDHRGACYVGGYAGGDQTWAGRELAPRAGQDVLVAKFDADGRLVWLHEGHGSGSAMIHEITADESGEAWASGMFRGELKLADRTVANRGEHDLLLTRFDAEGRRTWTKTAGGERIDYGLGVATDGRGNSFLTGSFAGRTEFEGGAQESRPAAASDLFVASYDRAGAPRWFVQAGSPRTDHAYVVVRDARGALYLSGACSGPATFGRHELPHAGSNDVFLAKLSEPAPAANGR